MKPDPWLRVKTPVGELYIVSGAGAMGEFTTLDGRKVRMLLPRNTVSKLQDGPRGNFARLMREAAVGMRDCKARAVADLIFAWLADCAALADLRGERCPSNIAFEESELTWY